MDAAACRMLCPRAFDGPVAPEALLAWDDDRRALAGLAVFHRLGRETGRAHVIVVRPYRHRGIGSLLLRQVIESARARHDERVWGEVDLSADPDPQPFLAAHGFSRGPVTVRFEGGIAEIRGPLQTFLDRLNRAGKVPATATVVDSSVVPAGRLVRWFEEVAAPSLDGRAALSRYIVAAPEFQRAVLLVDGCIAGFLAGVPNDGRGLATLLAVVVSPAYRGGWGWANLLLLDDALARASAAGASRIRFETGEKNWSVLATAARVSAESIGRSAVFTLSL
jgi:GNAT superfamily N-acetyltransferase